METPNAIIPAKVLQSELDRLRMIFKDIPNRTGEDVIRMLEKYLPENIEADMRSRISAVISIVNRPHHECNMAVYSNGVFIDAIAADQNISLVACMNAMHDAMMQAPFDRKTQWEDALDDLVENRSHVQRNGHRFEFQEFEEFFKDKPALYADLYEEEGVEEEIEHARRHA